MSKKFNKRLLILLCVSTFSLISTASYSHNGQPNLLPWHACEEKALDNECSYKTSTKIYNGSCRSINNALMCVRNQPLIYINKTEDGQTHANEHNH